MKIKVTIRETFIYVFLIVMLAVTVFPIVYTVSASLMSNVEIMAGSDSIFPKNPTFDNYRAAWNSEDFDIKRLLFNSLYYTFFSMMFSIISSAVCGYVFERGEFRGKSLVFGAFSMTMFFSMVGGVTLYPVFKILNSLNLNRSLSGLLFMKMFGVGIINVYLVRSYVRMLPKEIDEAAEIDGCNFITIFIRIILPLLKPILATIAILAFQGSWNDYLMPTIFTISNPKARTLIVAITALKSSGEAASAWNLMFAGAVIAIIPVLLAYAFLNRYFVEGITQGAVKG